jgi:hypothetical protein
VVALGRAWGLRLEADGRAITLYTPPVLGGYRTALPDRYGLAVAVGALLVALLPTLARRLRWSALMATVVVATGGWWAALAQLDGAGGFTRGLEWETDWGPRLAVSEGPAELLRTYVDRLPSSSIQVRGHPPGFLLLTLGLRSLGGARPAVVATILFLAGLSAVVAVLLSVRLVVDETAARRLVPYLVLAPAALWLVMAPDTLYVAVTAWLVYLLLVALHTPGWRADVLAVAAGALGAAAALLSYGLVLIGFIPLFAAVHARRWRPLVVAAGTAAALVVALVPFGFWWFAGLAATRHEYDTLGVDRPYPYFVVNNLAAWGLAIGPAVVVGFVRLRDRRAWVLAGGALAAVAVANLSGLSEGEVERIWLPFTLWAFVAAVALGDGGLLGGRALLVLQAGTALVLSAVVGTYW